MREPNQNSVESAVQQFLVLWLILAFTYYLYSRMPTLLELRELLRLLPQRLTNLMTYIKEHPQRAGRDLIVGIYDFITDPGEIPPAGDTREFLEIIGPANIRPGTFSALLDRIEEADDPLPEPMRQAQILAGVGLLRARNVPQRSNNLPVNEHDRPERGNDNNSSSHR